MAKKKSGKDVEKVGLIFRLNVEAHTALKVLAAKQRRTLSAIAVDAFNDYLEKHGEPRLAMHFSKGETS